MGGIIKQDASDKGIDTGAILNVVGFLFNCGVKQQKEK
jgi:hypothetical protein